MVHQGFDLFVYFLVTTSAHILDLSHRKQVSKWVITELVTEGNTKVRAGLYERFVAVAQNLEKLNNFNGCIAILTGLQSSPIYRLKETQNVG